MSRHLGWRLVAVLLLVGATLRVDDQTLRTFREVPDIGAHWSSIAADGADASDALEQAGFP